MDVEVKNKKKQTHLKDDELRRLIQSSQSGDPGCEGPDCPK